MRGPLTFMTCMALRWNAFLREVRDARCRVGGVANQGPRVAPRKEAVVMKRNLEILSRLRVAFVAASVASLCVLGAVAGSSFADESKVDVNRAGVEALAALPGIGDAKAKAIVAERARKPFASVDELVRVRGIGSSTLDGLRDRVSTGSKP